MTDLALLRHSADLHDHEANIMDHDDEDDWSTAERLHYADLRNTAAALRAEATQHNDISRLQAKYDALCAENLRLSKAFDALKGLT